MCRNLPTGPGLDTEEVSHGGRGRPTERGVGDAWNVNSRPVDNLGDMFEIIWIRCGFLWHYIPFCSERLREQRIPCKCSPTILLISPCSSETYKVSVHPLMSSGLVSNGDCYRIVFTNSLLNPNPGFGHRVNITPSISRFLNYFLCRDANNEIGTSVNR